MLIGIDATNIKAGGGLTHLKHLIDASKNGNNKIEIIGGIWLESIKEQAWVSKIIHKSEYSSLWKQELFKRLKLPLLLQNCDISLVPGGTFSSRKVKYVSMSQNMLVFENKERNRYRWTFNWFRYHLLERLQVRSFRNAAGIIYISNYAKNYIEKKYPVLRYKKSCVIYHGISDDFRQMPKEQKSIESYTRTNPFILTYISIVNFYKHQWNVIDAVNRLHVEGYPIVLKLIGPIYKAAKGKFEKAMVGKEGIVEYLGPVPYDVIAENYKESDLFIFASTCENMPNILVEAMSAGLPILSSNYGPMPEILKDGGEYMDPTDIESIYLNLKRMLDDKQLRQDKADKAYKYSKTFSWEKTSEETFEFLRKVYEESKSI